ncbi:MAG: site-specific integrase, partial [Gammaproteobacteria bacterium]
MNGKPSNHCFRILSHSDSVFCLFLEGLPRAIPQGALCLPENNCFPTGQRQLWVDGGRSKSSNGGWCHDCLFYPSNACQTAQEKLIVWTLLDTGLRVSELCGLTAQSIQWQQRQIRVKGKGGPYGQKTKVRTVPMSLRVRALLE